MLLVIPGPAVLYIVARSASPGRQAGLVSVAGVHTGTVVHIFASVVGLSALIVAWATAFSIVKLAGAAYLVYLGVHTLLAGRRLDRADAVEATPLRSMRRVYTDAVVLNILNPKTAVFFLAFVPQFVDPARGETWTQLLVLGAIFVVLGALSDSAYALTGAWLGSRVLRVPAKRRRTGLVAGTTYIGLGAMTAASGGTRS